MIPIKSERMAGLSRSKSRSMRSGPRLDLDQAKAA